MLQLRFGRKEIRTIYYNTGNWEMVINEDMSFWQKILRPKVIFLNVSKSLYHSDTTTKNVLFEFFEPKIFNIFSKVTKLESREDPVLLCYVHTKLHLYSNPVVESWIYICYYIQIWHWPTFLTTQSRWRV